MATKTQRALYTVYAGEGAGEAEGRTVYVTPHGLERILTRERCNGDRWAFARDIDGARV